MFFKYHVLCYAKPRSLYQRAPKVPVGSPKRLLNRNTVCSLVSWFHCVQPYPYTTLCLSIEPRRVLNSPRSLFQFPGPFPGSLHRALLAAIPRLIHMVSRAFRHLFLRVLCVCFTHPRRSAVVRPLLRLCQNEYSCNIYLFFFRLNLVVKTL